MTRGLPTRVVGSCLGLTAFAVSIVAGLGAGNPADEILTRAIIAMVALYALGQALGVIAERAVDQRIAQHMKENPVGGVRAGGAGAANEVPIDV